MRAAFRKLIGSDNLMALYVPKNVYSITQNQRSTISTRYKTVTKAINTSLWNSVSESAHSFYVGSYGRGTAIDTSDIDILIEVPSSFYVQNSYTTYNPQSRLLQVVKNAILNSYPRSDVHADGQVVVIDFTDGIKFEVLPAIPQMNCYGRTSYEYPDSHKDGRWMSTNPKAEQDAIEEKNRTSNGLLLDTCKHMRYIRDNYFSSYQLSGIVIDSFVYAAMESWRWLHSGESGSSAPGDYESVLLRYYNYATCYGQLSSFVLNAPGSGNTVSTQSSALCLGKVLKKMAE